MTGEETKEVLDKVESLAKESENWRRDYGRMLKERDEARREVEKLKEVVSGHDELFRHLNKKISDLEMDVSVERLAHANTSAQLAAERAKKSGPVEGTWAWACEQLVGKKRVKRERWPTTNAWAIDRGSVKSGGLDPDFFEENILATDWRVVES